MTHKIAANKIAANEAMPRVSLKFSLLSSREVERRSRLRVIHPHLHGSGGVLDRRLATSDGHVRLELPVYHIGYLAQTLAVLGRVCKTCSAADPGPKDETANTYGFAFA